jgi:hypothetical protein
VAAYGATATRRCSSWTVRDRPFHGGARCGPRQPGRERPLDRDALDSTLAGRAVSQAADIPGQAARPSGEVELLWWQGCPSYERAAELLGSALAELKRGDVAVVRREVTTPEEASQLNFPGSPTFQVGRRDLLPVAAAPALNCRVYRTPDGRVSPLPDRAELAARLHEALARPWDLPGVDPVEKS